MGRCIARRRGGTSPTPTCTPTLADRLVCQCIRVNPKWSKGYARKGAALHGAHRWDDAIAAYEEGLKLEDSPALRRGLKEVHDGRGMCTYASFRRACSSF